MVAITVIEYYQRYLSPYKGFCCPHRVVHGGRSCSEQGKRIIRRVGLRRGMLLLERRLLQCRTTALVLQQSAAGGGPPAAAGGPKGKSSACGNTCEAIGCGVQGLEIIGDIISCFG